MHTPLRKLLYYPSSKPTYRLCLHENSHVFNLSAGDPPRYMIGAEATLLQIIFDVLGINFMIFVPDDEGWGVPDENNVWSGCPGMIQRNEVHIAIGGMLQNYWSFQFSHQSFMSWDEGAYFIARTPDFLAKPYVIFQTFEVTVWISLLISLLVIALAYYFIMQRRYSYGTQLFSRLAELLLQEPIIKIKRVASQEIIVLVWSMAVQFITLSYMAVILTTIMVPKTELPINNEDRVLEGVKSGKFIAAIPKDMPMFLDNLLSNTRSSFREIGELIQANNWAFHINKTNYAEYLKQNYIIASAIFTYNFFNPLGNPIVVPNDPIYSARLCLLTRKDFPLKDKLDDVMMRLFEAGLTKKGYEEYVFQSRLKDDLHYTSQDDERVKVLSVYDLQSAFYVLCFGYVISIITFLVEMVIVKCTETSTGSLDEISSTMEIDDGIE